MGIEITEEAVEVLRHSLELAGLEGGQGGARLRAARALGGGINLQVELAAGCSDGEELLEKDGVRIFVDRSLIEAMPEAVVAVEPPHGRIVVRPAGA